MNNYKEALKFLEESEIINIEDLKKALSFFPTRFIQDWRIMPFYKKCNEAIKLFEDNYTFREISDFIINDIPLQKHYCIVCGKEIHSNNRRYPVTCSRRCATKRQMAIKNKKNLKAAMPINSKKTSLIEIGEESITLESVIEHTLNYKRGYETFLKNIYQKFDKTNTLLKLGHNVKDIIHIIKNNLPLEPQLCTICGKNIVHVRGDKFIKTCSKKCAIELGKQTCLKTYGTTNGGWTKESQAKIRKTNLEKYGTKYASQNEDIKKKIAKTNIQRYGYVSPFGSKEIQEKSKKTNLLKFGYKYANQNSENKKILSKTKLDKSFDNLFKFSNIVKPDFSREEWTGCGLSKQYKWKCLECGETFSAYINGPAHLPICRKCHPYSISSGQEELINFIKTFYTGEIIINDRKQLDGKEIDIWIPEFKLGIEFNGNFWHSINCDELNESCHINKTKLAESKGIHLIQIFEHEWDYKKNLVKHRINNALTNSKHVYARKCTIKEISTTERKQFLNTYHLQGDCPANINIGLFFKNELIGVMSFGKPRFNKKYEWELLRFATSKRVIGGAGKLLKYFELVYSPKSLISYADRKWSSKLNNVYTNIGFNLIGESIPSYYYLKKDVIINRYKAQKRKLIKLLGDKFNEHLSETQNMINAGFLKIYDCGNLVFEKIY